MLRFKTFQWGSAMPEEKNYIQKILEQKKIKILHYL
jgi:hypothetical protein